MQGKDMPKLEKLAVLTRIVMDYKREKKEYNREMNEKIKMAEAEIAVLVGNEGE